MGWRWLSAGVKVEIWVRLEGFDQIYSHIFFTGYILFNSNVGLRARTHPGLIADPWCRERITYPPFSSNRHLHV